MLNFSIFGAPGSGKGTHSVQLAVKYGLKHISTGDLFRKEIAKHTHIGQYIRQFVNEGNLIPDATVLKEVYRTALCHRYAKGYIFDGFPRTVVQAEMLDKLLLKKNLALKLVIYIKVPEKELLQRLRERAQISERSDDKTDVIANRMEIYKQMTFPVLEYYKKQGKLIEIDGMHPIEITFSDICTNIELFINSHRKL